MENRKYRGSFLSGAAARTGSYKECNMKTTGKVGVVIGN